MFRVVGEGKGTVKTAYFSPKVDLVVRMLQILAFYYKEKQGLKFHSFAD